MVRRATCECKKNFHPGVARGPTVQNFHPAVYMRARCPARACRRQDRDEASMHDQIKSCQFPVGQVGKLNPESMAKAYSAWPGCTTFSDKDIKQNYWMDKYTLRGQPVS